MIEPDDSLDELREAWRALAPPEPTAAEPDAAERAAIEWMRGAWSALESPVAAPPRRLLRPRPLRRVLALAPLAAAAALLVMALLVARSLAPERAETARAPAPIVQRTEPAVVSTALAALEREEGGLELRHGTVRLILLPPEPSLAESGGDAR